MYGFKKKDGEMFQVLFFNTVVLSGLGWAYIIFITCTLAGASVSPALGLQQESYACRQGPFMTAILDKSFDLSDPLFLPVKIVKEFLFHVAVRI